MKITQKKQADGAQTFDTTLHTHVRIWQLQIDVSSPAVAGTMTVEVVSPGMTNLFTIGTIDLVNGPLVYMIPMITERIVLTPIGLDSNKHYTAGLTVYE